MSIQLKTAAVAALSVTAAAWAAPITPGDLVIYRVGDGSATLGNTGTAVFLDEYTPAGTLVQSIAQATSGTGAFVASGSASSEGLLTATADGKYVAFTGYNTAAGTTGVAGTTSAAVPRSVGVLNTAAGTATYTNLTDYSTGNNPRSAVTTTGTDLYVSGGAGGVRYANVGDTTSTLVSAGTVVNFRQVNAFAGQLYTSGSSGAVRLATIGSGVPTAAGQTVTNLPGLPTSAGSPYGYFLADLDGTVAGVDTLYVADDSAGLQKYSLVSGTWTLNNTVGATANAFRGLTGVVTAAGVTLFATGNGNTLYTLTDTAGYNANDNGTAASIATAATNTAFRGVAYVAVAPAQAVPEPAALGLLGLTALIGRRRRRA